MRHTYQSISLSPTLKIEQSKASTWIQTLPLSALKTTQLLCHAGGYRLAATRLLYCQLDWSLQLPLLVGSNSKCHMSILRTGAPLPGGHVTPYHLRHQRVGSILRVGLDMLEAGASESFGASLCSKHRWNLQGAAPKMAQLDLVMLKLAGCVYVFNPQGAALVAPRSSHIFYTLFAEWKCVSF